MGSVLHNCGICVGRTLHDTYSFLDSLQHRGRDAAGLFGVRENGKIDVLKWIGEVESFDRHNLSHIFKENYHTFGGHVRYATKGKSKEDLLKNAHPVTSGGEEDWRDNHIIIRDCDAAIIHNGHVSDKYLENIEEDLLTTGTDTERLLHLYLKSGIGELVRNIPGAYNMVIADKKNRDVIAVRDKTGIRPGFLGKKDQKHVISSEDNALVRNGAIILEEMIPGTVYYLSPNGKKSTESFVEPDVKRCFFEWNYVANAGSTLRGISVREMRSRLGKKLAEEFGEEFKDSDFVTFLPSCPEPAAWSFANSTKIPFLDNVFYKRKARRAFQGPDAKERANSIKGNLYLTDGIERTIRGKKLILIDDSTIRGNNSKYAKHLLYDVAGVEEAFLLNYSPKFGIIPSDGMKRGCEYGIDMPPEENENHKFVARGRDVEEISNEIGMPVRFLSVKGMMDVFENFGIMPEKMCSFCIGGDRPFENLEEKIEN